MHIGCICSHTAAETAFKLLSAFYQNKFYPFTDSFVKIILFAAVFQINLILNFNGVDVTCPAEQKNVFFRRFALPVFVFRKIKKSLCNRSQNFFHRVSRAFPVFNILIFVNLPV